MALAWGAAALWALAAGAEEPAAEPEEIPVRHTNPGFGLGLTSLGAASPTDRVGLLLDLRKEEAIAPRLQFNAVLSAGVTRPQNAAAVAGWGWRAGGSITRSYGDVSRWVRAGQEDDTDVFRGMGAFFAYFGLTLSYVVVPAAAVVSPVASVGHVVGGGTFSLHTGPESPNAFVEGGFGAMVYGHPISGAPGAGCGPLLGVGAQIGHQTLGLRLLVSPPGLNVAADGRSDLLWSSALALGF